MREKEEEKELRKGVCWTAGLDERGTLFRKDIYISFFNAPPPPVAGYLHFRRRQEEKGRCGSQNSYF